MRGGSAKASHTTVLNKSFVRITKKKMVWTTKPKELRQHEKSIITGAFPTHICRRLSTWFTNKIEKKICELENVNPTRTSRAHLLSCPRLPPHTPYKFMSPNEYAK